MVSHAPIGFPKRVSKTIAIISRLLDSLVSCHIGSGWACTFHGVNVPKNGAGRYQDFREKSRMYFGAFAFPSPSRLQNADQQNARASPITEAKSTLPSKPLRSARAVRVLAGIHAYAKIVRA